MEDLPVEVSADGERATLKSPPTITQGPPKEASLVRVDDRKRAWSVLGAYILATVKRKLLNFSLRNTKRPWSSIHESRTSG